MKTKKWQPAIDELIRLRSRGKPYDESEELTQMLGTCYVESGRPKDGIPLLQEVFQKAKTVPYRPGAEGWFRVGYELAKAFKAVGEPAQAVKVTGYVKVLYPDFWKGANRETASLADDYRELHKQCGGT